MKVGTKEHYDILNMFEREFYHMRLDREPRELWASGQVYQNGETNNAYRAYVAGYALGRVSYMHG
ncbi:hypothetical protein ACFQ3W_24840 [Paenibacillus puldeungensis]|uniref:Uncharacterized protein n=1 Tax=Paenibacillus puldeungensis TaxID=696536 RepID=A0ABW3S5P9_9BACL